jgi:outer membrane protein assembly factor BamE (lipoprotein component of BamABCDE complex)
MTPSRIKCLQRAQVANYARAQMVGLSKEQVLACMGAPSSRASEGATEVWSYSSGDGTRTAIASGTSAADLSLYGSPSPATGTMNTTSTVIGIPKGDIAS